MNIYVGNLAYGLTDANLKEIFSPYGEVASASIIMDRDSGRSKGFGFVEMPNNTEAENAIKNLNGKEVQGRNITVNQAKPRTERERPPRRSRY
jgi:RNA recognition motif-containing protein